MVQTRSRSNSISVSDSSVVKSKVDSRNSTPSSTSTSRRRRIPNKDHHDDKDELQAIPETTTTTIDNKVTNEATNHKVPQDGLDNDIETKNNDKIGITNDSSSPSSRRSNKKGSTKSTDAKKKKEIERQLRMKATGIGIEIIPSVNDSTIHETDNKLSSSSSKPLNRKIVFSDVDEIFDNNDFNVDDDDANLDVTQPKNSTANDEIDDDDDDDDDNVEEIKTSTAKDQIQIETLHQRIAQKSDITKIQKNKKRKNKQSLSTKNKNDEIDDDDRSINMDDNYFQQLENEQKQIKKRKKTSIRFMDDMMNDNDHKSNQKTFIINTNTNELQPYETTSTSESELSSNKTDIIVKNNINIVVLKQNQNNLIERPFIDNQMNDSNDDPMVDKLNYYSRYGCIDHNHNRQVQQQQHETNTIAKYTTTKEMKREQKQSKSELLSISNWKRSTSMNRILSVPSRARQKGTAAIHFTTKRK